MASFQRKRHSPTQELQVTPLVAKPAVGVEAPVVASLIYVVPRAYVLSLQCRDQRPTGLCREYLTKV